MNQIKVYQIKDIFRLYLEKNPDIIIKYKSKNKKDLLNLIKQHKIKLDDYKDKYITEMTSKKLLKKYDVKPYNNKEKMKFLEDENILGQ